MLRYFRVPASRPVIVAGSTMKGEEEVVIRAFNRFRSTAAGANALLIVPEDRGEIPAGERLSALLLTEDAGTSEAFAL